MHSTQSIKPVPVQQAESQARKARKYSTYVATVQTPDTECLWQMQNRNVNTPVDDHLNGHMKEGGKFLDWLLKKIK